MQTYNPEHFSIEAARRQDYINFFDNEAPFRKALMYPPFTRMIQLKISGKDEKKVAGIVEQVADVLKQLLSTSPEIQESVQILGPIEASIHRISSRFRWQILIKSPSSVHLSRLVNSMKAHPTIKAAKQVSIAIDVDPYSLM
jgi:primosomal protein N' (replication factor Y)